MIDHFCCSHVRAYTMIAPNEEKRRSIMESKFNFYFILDVV